VHTSFQALYNPRTRRIRYNSRVSYNILIHMRRFSNLFQNVLPLSSKTKSDKLSKRKSVQTTTTANTLVTRELDSARMPERKGTKYPKYKV
jgi:hypothetical protein